jgi:hypothetical protein
MSLSINYLSTDDIQQRRQELLKRANMTLAELRDRAAGYLLDEKQNSILLDLEDLDYLEAKPE